MPMGPKCSMNMLWNTDIIDTCIVFRSWHINSQTTFLFSCLVIVLLGIFYEYLRGFQKKFDYHIAMTLAAKGQGRPTPGRDSSGRSTPEGQNEERSLLGGRRILTSSLTGTPVSARVRAIRATLYGLTIFLSFFLMLVFMTYNAYLITSVVLGAALGHYIFSPTMNVDAILADSTAGKGMACH